MTQKEESPEDEAMNFDVVIVGAGPSGLSAAIKLGQLAKENNREISICVVEKGSEVGAHILSGAVLEPRALKELFPDLPKIIEQDETIPLKTPAIEDSFLLLTGKKHFKLSTPPQMKNHGNYILSLGNLCRWLAKKSEELGVQIFPGFPAKEIVYNNEGKVAGIITGEFGINPDGTKKNSYQPGVKILGKYTLFAEGCRGSLTRTLEEKFNLREESSPQTYAIGLKELWEIPAEKHNQGTITHTVGWPLERDTYGGSFIYHLENNQISIGYVIGLDYSNPHLNPFREFQKFKTHPYVTKLLKGGKRISYGARALNEGGFQSIPKLSFPGGALIGCGAGFMNVPKIKGSHTAMKSGMLAAEAIFERLDDDNADLNIYESKLKSSWIYDELKKVRNIRPSFKNGFWKGLIYSAIDSLILRGRAPWTFKHHEDHKQLKPADKCKKPVYPEPDGKITFDLLSSVFISNTNHEEKQPIHLTLKDSSIPINTNLKLYDAPEQRYCPAGVYEIVEENNEPRLQINAQNCLHCKTCDIKDPTQNIVWTTPEGGGGPNYPNM